MSRNVNNNNEIDPETGLNPEQELYACNTLRVYETLKSIPGYDDVIARVTPDCIAILEQAITDLRKKPEKGKEAMNQRTAKRKETYKKIWDSFTKQNSITKLEFNRVSALFKITGSVSELDGPGLNDTVVFLDVQNQRRLAAVPSNVRAPGTTKMATRPPNAKPQKSFFRILLNTNRNIGGASTVQEMQAVCLISALRLVLTKLLSQVKENGAYLIAWTETTATGQIAIPVKINKLTVKDTVCNFRIERGPNNGYCHAHILILVEHFMKVQFDVDMFKSHALMLLNGLLASGDRRYNFSIPLSNLKVEVRNFFAKDLAQAEMWWRTYSKKEDEIWAAYYRQQIDDGDTGQISDQFSILHAAGVPQQAQGSLVQALEEDVDGTMNFLLEDREHRRSNKRRKL